MDVLDPQAQDAAVLRGVFLFSKLKTFDATQLKNLKIGGKARGLVRLMQLGLNVPPGFVVIRSSASFLPDFRVAYAELASDELAVRSSMEGEDGRAHSFAGQFETVLQQTDFESVQAAVLHCFESFENARSRQYRNARAAECFSPAVIVQRMVRARKAGVLFTLDPVTQDRDRIVIEVVSGLADGLVAGAQCGFVLHLSRAGEVVFCGGESAEMLLTAEEISALVAGALHAEKAQGVPLDFEWAIDESGVLHWLQMRPITALDFDPNEFDTPEIAATAVLTRGNVGEILPGAVTPLTLSTTVPAIEQAMQKMFSLAGLETQDAPARRIFKTRLGHLFIDLSEMVQLAGVILGAQEENLVVPFCGRMLPGISRVPRAPWWSRARSSLRFFRELVAVQSRIRGFERAFAATDSQLTLSSETAQWQEIDRALGLLRESCEVHLLASLGSGVMHGILAEWLRWCGVPQETRDREIAEALRGIDEVDAIPVALDGIFEELLDQVRAQTCFFEADPEAARAWLHDASDRHEFVSFKNFLQCYGHRGEREFEMSAPSWRMDPLPLIRALQTRFAAPRPGSLPVAAASLATGGSRLDFVRLGVVHLARAAVRNREHTKSLSVQVVERFKLAYRNLGRLLERTGALADAEDIFFLTHEEIGRFVSVIGSRDDSQIDSGVERMAALIRARRRAYAMQQRLEFADFCPGKPEPLRARELPANADAISGQPVSRGLVTGPARVVRSLEEMARMAADRAAFRGEEILIVPTIDVGWTPYFGCIAGLATEIGSAVSHGAVLAREYGLPAVVNLRNATQIFRTGDWVTLDAERGVLARVSSDGPGVDSN